MPVMAETTINMYCCNILVEIPINTRQCKCIVSSRVSCYRVYVLNVCVHQEIQHN